VARAANDGGKDGTGSIVTGETGLAHTGSVVDNEGLDFTAFSGFSLHTTTQAEDEVKGGFLLDVVVSQSATIFELLASEDQALLIRRNAFLVLDLLLDVFDGVRALDVEGDGLTCGM